MDAVAMGRQALWINSGKKGLYLYLEGMACPYVMA
jgi:hypothetical protein